MIFSNLMFIQKNNKLHVCNIKQVYLPTNFEFTPLELICKDTVLFEFPGKLANAVIHVNMLRSRVVQI